ncbi:RNA polymerase II-binding domain-containing protein [Lineolata rhizophorae]|uniref:RNA polymerase II-binding domain-containing protein n=1 Tax=Lineolata rhizophorae TaxID=578093 RepID=A0A6A6NRQ9_9PEZI|nr:RNA polymerase II-binding domain-containing protein [Lineolata rhizophorae]
MAYTDDSVKAKLSALNDTQEGIVSVAQWIMFHRRHADRTAQLWQQRLKDSNASKRLNLVYLANEVVQQSKARQKKEFVMAFSNIIADATAAAYRGAPNDIQQKLRRVIEVWRARQIFDPAIQDAIERNVDGEFHLAPLAITRTSNCADAGPNQASPQNRDRPHPFQQEIRPRRWLTLR